MRESEFVLEEQQLILRDLPEGSYLVHSTNCLGVWGAGIAREIGDMFPTAYSKYKNYCNAFEREPGKTYASRALTGNCLIIPSQQEDIAFGAPKLSIVCLFTSHGYGRKSSTKPGRDSKHLILKQTTGALDSFRSQLDSVVNCTDGQRTEEQDGQINQMKRVYSPKFNSGLFKVPWEETADKIREIFHGWYGRWTILVQ